MFELGHLLFNGSRFHRLIVKMSSGWGVGVFCREMKRFIHSQVAIALMMAIGKAQVGVNASS
jgi:hypothetical protein